MGWTDRIFPADSKKQSKEKEWKLSDYVTMTIPPELRKKCQELEQLTPTQTAVIAIAAGLSFAVGFKAGRMQPVWKSYTNVQDIPSTYFGATAFIRGRCLSVSDGDTIRFRHAPTFLNRSKLNDGEKLSDVTMAVRICTIDTPETAKFGKPGQPFGDKAKDLLSNMLENEIVYCRLLQKDQYGRAVAEVRTGRWPFYRYADEKMLKSGLAEVYLGSGAVYGHRGKDYYLAMEEKAINSKIGMWKDKNRESAAEYKARVKA